MQFKINLVTLINSEFRAESKPDFSVSQISSSKRLFMPLLLTYFIVVKDAYLQIVLQINCRFLQHRPVCSCQTIFLLFIYLYTSEFDVYWTVHHCDNWRIKTQLDATWYFIVLLIGCTCFEHCYAHHQELATVMLITTLVVSFFVCCRLEVRCGYAGVESGLQAQAQRWWEY